MRTINPLFSFNEPNLRAKRTQCALFTKNHEVITAFLQYKGTCVRKHKELTHFVQIKELVSADWGEDTWGRKQS
ncbi:hypothetical protein V7127_10270 [Bacillus sp. JJ1773]|uniref:hypothetical protein n=1 Tax=Bacillus sp. JJ1773 TaxID=3122965 RepID=UPI003000DA2C